MTNNQASNKQALITGTSSGIGRGLSQALLKNGQQVSGVARRAEKLKALADEHSSFTPLPGDLLDPSFRISLAETYLESNGAPDYLILNAGLAHYGSLENIRYEQIAEQVSLNVVSVIHLTQLFYPAMVKRGTGRILIVSSVLGVGVIPYAATYCATKHAVNAFVRALRLDLKGSGVSVSALCPGGVATEFNKVASGDENNVRSGQEPLDKVVDGMVRQLDKDVPVIYPTWSARMRGFMMDHFPAFTDRMLVRSRETFAAQLPPGRVSSPSK